MKERKYLPTLAELIDRLSIIQLKEVFIAEHKKEYAEEIKAFKASGKKIITLPTITPATHEVNVEGLGVDNDRFAEDLSNFNSKYKERK